MARGQHHLAGRFALDHQPDRVPRLLERQLVKVVGRKQVVGRPFLYATTREFLSRFGLNDLSDLPKVEDMAEALGLAAHLDLSEPHMGVASLPFEEGSAGPRSGTETPEKPEEKVEKVH